MVSEADLFLPERDDERVVENLEDGDETAAHGEAEDAADVGDEPDRRHFLVALDLWIGQMINNNLSFINIYFIKINLEIFYKQRKESL